MEADTRTALADWLRAETGADMLKIEGAKMLSGGAIQENWLLELTVSGGRLDGMERAVLRTDAASGVDESHGRPEEFRLLTAGFEAGMTVPEPLVLEETGEVTGKPFYVMRAATGTANPRHLTRDAAMDPLRGDLARQIGREMARLHTIRAPRPELAFLGAPPADSAAERIAELYGFLDSLPKAYPALEWGLRWLELNKPAPGAPALCHRDFRTGNYMVADGHLTAVLDWEFAGWSDPLEDIGWFCARCWRFGMDDREAGGIGARADLYAGYEEAAGAPLDWAQVPFWEVLATVRWGTIALLQGERHNSGGERSIELALTGRKAAEMELDVLQQVAAIEWSKSDA
ncbi:phosphotransferase family protein [Nisaea acidiphila]|uniref:Phosphotransferase family protein n=1 Tax=Nisaea acidiphila TaxID=1862145 RepID=A0A9J7AVZ3_9PROT|nr:phosphotransferase family protein [Nisaea acidiphila]UUX50444.1 phosphotransferase family protein [Nisaea acidiphila]